MDLAGGVATANDATVHTGGAPERSRLERAAGTWEHTVEVTVRSRRKVDKLRAQLADAERGLHDAIDAEQCATVELEAAKAEIGGNV